MVTEFCHNTTAPQQAEEIRRRATADRTKSYPESPRAKRWRTAGTKCWRALNSKGLCKLEKDENQDVSRCMQGLADQYEVVHEKGSLAVSRQTFPG